MSWTIVELELLEQAKLGPSLITHIFHNILQNISLNIHI